MIVPHVHSALRQVRDLHHHIIEKQRFRGYSGRARILSGALALVTMLILRSSHFPQTEIFHFAAWMTLLFLAVLLNYGALLYWFFFDPEVERNPRLLRPALDVFPIFAVAGVLTTALLLKGQSSLIFGTWMCLFGLANLTSRQVLPRLTSIVGIFYLLSGAYCLLDPRIAFTHPLPMGIVFFIGELFGGIVFHFDQSGSAQLKNFFKGDKS